MANTKISDLTEISTVTSTDETVLVDVSDITDGAAGSSKKATMASIIGSSSITLTNKTINADNNTVSNLAHGSEVDNTTTSHGATGAVVGTTNTQTLTNKTLTTPTITAGVAATSFDMNGTELILDGDADTSIHADTDDQIDIRIAAADDFKFTANTFEALSGSDILIANNESYQAKQAGGTVKDLIKLGTDDILRLSQMRYQSITTNSTSENILIQRGFSFIQGDGANRSLQKTITFPTAFTTIPTVVLTNIGYKSASDPTDEGDTSALAAMKWKFGIYDTSTSQVSVQVIRTSDDGADPGVLQTTNRYMFTWLAIGIG